MVLALPRAGGLSLLIFRRRAGSLNGMTITTAPPPTAAGSACAGLNRRVSAAGLLRRRPAHYALRLTVVTLMLAGGWTAFVLVGPSWWTLAVAAFLALVFAQIALVAHDLAHR